MADFTLPRITEKRYFKIIPQPFTADATNQGLITIASTYSFKVGQLVIIKSTTQPDLKVKVQTVISETQFIVIDIGEAVTTKKKLDISAYLLADTAAVEFLEDKRPVIDLHEIQRQVYEEEPTVALRTHSVDWLGRPYDKTNPFQVQLSDGSINIGTVNAELEVQLSHKDNTPNPGDVADSVQIGDGVETLAINSDGSINVVIENAVAGIPISIYDEILLVPSSLTSTILTYIVPTTAALLESVNVSGTNIATYEVLVNGVVIDKKRTYFSGALNEVFNFNNFIKLSTSDIVRIQVTHSRPTTASFNARIALTEST
jgi:hypothetical protein